MRSKNQFKDFNFSKCNLLLFFLDLSEQESFRGMYWKLKVSMFHNKFYTILY